jgi:hypothetical protein
VWRAISAHSSPRVELQAFTDLPSEIARRLQQFDGRFALCLRRFEAFRQHGHADLRLELIGFRLEDAADTVAGTHDKSPSENAGLHDPRSSIVIDALPTTAANDK